VKKDDGSMELCAFYEPEMNQEEILAHIRNVLPKYMIPARFVAMASIPTTATNKIDMQTLLRLAVEGVPVTVAEPAPKTPAPVKKTGAKAKKAAGKVTTDYILSVWNKVLTIPVQDVNASFFEQGGTSMGALNVLSHYFNDSFEMSLSEFYEHPTAAGQAALLGGQRSRKDPAQIPVAEMLKPQAPVPAPAAVAPIRRGKKILVTGATGFFGAHLVHELLSRGQQVICLLRDGSKERLEECLAWYFGQGTLLRAKKLLSVVKGDISLPHLGMEEADYAALAGQISQIYHSAADVRHYVSEEDPYLSVNLGGTVNILELAKAAQASFYYMSTCSVSGDHMRTGDQAAEFTEMDYDIGQIWEENIYVRSKFLAEGQALQAAQEGLDVKIFRLGRLVGRASDGVFQRNPESNVFYLILNGFKQLGAIPAKSAGEKIDLMPIDICVDQVLALTDGENRIYHIMHSDPPVLSEVMQALDPDIAIVDDAAFARVLAEKAPQMNPELAALLMDHWHRSKVNPPVITVSNELTQEHLRQAGFTQEIPAPEQILSAF
jgi:thioester reductase-like protein